jgi:hypothetical protein
VLKTFAAVLLATGVAVAAATPTCGIVPGWTQAGAPRSYTADNLFEYMDSNAEGYILYGFQEMHGVTCKKGEVTFVLDISDMGDADFAYGMFSANRDLRQPEYRVGMGGQIVPRRLIFAKGQYYVEIAANPEGDYTPALKEFAAALEKTVPGSTAPPVALGWFPAEKQQSLRLVPESVLGLRMLQRGYVAQYEFGKAFVVMDESAGELMAKLRARFGETSPVKIADEAFVGADKYLGRLCIFRKGRYVGGYAVPAENVDPVALARVLSAKIP